MNKQFSRNNRRAKEKTGSRYRVAVILVILVVAIAGSVTYVAWSKRNTAQQAFIARVNTWWVERKARIAIRLVKSQEKMNQATAAPKAKSSAPEPVHFEFYTMLPNNGATVVTESTPIFNHDNLEREFAKSVEKTAYIIQAGIYSNAALADKTRDALAEDGFAAKVIKAYIDERLVYRVQVGPYQEKDQISEAQSKLAARGIHGVLRKTEEKVA